jgi:hypothetical protein
VDHPGLDGAEGSAACEHERGARLARRAAAGSAMRVLVLVGGQF